jgi:NADH:ubiquinone oxidoreductase subunit 6 (subunit J)
MTFAFYFLAALTLVSALAVVQSRNIVHAGYWLLPCFIGIAGLFAALEAHFLFVAQLLIYAGAILVLILFAVMLTRNAARPDRGRANKLVIPAAFVSLLTASATVWIVSKHNWMTAGIKTPAGDPAAQTKLLGAALIGNYALPFEVASLVLVAALVGAVIVAKSDGDPEGIHAAAIARVNAETEPEREQLVGVEA